MLAASACTQAEQELQVSVLSSTPALKKKKRSKLGKKWMYGYFKRQKCYGLAPSTASHHSLKASPRHALN